ncbi:MAG: binary toxin-like calcium binding domain-containing protein, partial [bacterium]
AQLGTSDTALDSDQDGFSDYEEVVVYGSNPADSFSVPAAAVSGQILYFGTQSGIIHVLAPTNANTWSSPHYLTSLFPAPASVPMTSHATAFTLQNLPLRQTYSVRAYVDVNGNDLCDSWEPQGIAVPDITLTGTTNGVVVFLGDPDTDGDGLADAAELMLGLEPTVPDMAACLPYFAGFETNENFVAGLLNGQNGWTVTPAVTAMIQTNTVYEGAQAVLVDSGTSTSLVRRLISRASQLGSAILWLDYRAEVSAIGAFPAPTNTIASYAFDWKGRPVVWDGHLASTNKWVTLTNTAAASLSGWTRLTVGLNFDEQSWLLCLNGVLVAQNLGFGMPASELHAFDMKAGWAGLDNFAVTTNTPAQLSLDGDSMPDDWEMQYFGNLNPTDSGDADGDGVPNYAEYLAGTNPTNNDSGADADGDGLTNLQEYQHGTNPNAADSDHDGLPDAWEVAHGLDPILNDATADADEDGLTNLQEYQLGTNPQVADTDGDGMPDGWEVANGFNPLLASDAALDPDNDGLSNLQEYQNGTDPQNPDTDGDGLTDGAEVNTYKTSPVKADTDGDGMPDKWEVDHHFNPLTNDAGADPDNDGLSNWEEYRAGTDPFQADTCGAGMNDFESSWLFNQDPAQGNLIGEITVVNELRGAEASDFVGEWAVLGDQMRSTGLRGELVYEVGVTNAGIYRLAIIAGGARVPKARLICLVDDQFAGVNEHTVSSVSDSPFYFCTPFLKEGQHRIRIQWDNVLPGVELWISAVRLESMGGPDADGNGRPDWLDQRYSRIATLVAKTNSLVSPYCAEGRARFLDSLTLNSGVQPRRAAAEGWYANIPLLEHTNTEVVATFDEGNISRTNHVSWVPFNVLSEPDIVIRAGDALRLTAQNEANTEGVVMLSITGVTNYLSTSSWPVKHVFAAGGVFVVNGVYSNALGTIARSVRVTVMSGSLPAEKPAVWLSRKRSWSCPALPSDVGVVEGDYSMSVARNAAGAGSTVDITASDIEWPHGVVVRTGPGGSILDARPIDGFWVAANVEGFYPVVEKLQDGTTII